MVRKDALASSRKIKRKRLVLRLFLYFATVISILAVLVGFSYIPKLKIKEIEVIGISEFNKKILQSKFSEVMQKKYLGILPYDNIFIFPEKKLKAEVLSTYPEIKDIDFKNFFPEKVLTTASERELFAVWCFKEGDCSFVDEDGFIFKPSPFFYGNLFLKFFDERRESSSLGSNTGKQILPGDEFKRLISFINLADTIDISIYKIFVRDEGVYDLEASSGWHIILNNDNNPQETFQNLKIMLGNQLEEDYMSKIGYVDLRFGNKIFYKLNNE